MASQLIDGLLQAVAVDELRGCGELRILSGVQVHGCLETMAGRIRRGQSTGIKGANSCLRVGSQCHEGRVVGRQGIVVTETSDSVIRWTIQLLVQCEIALLLFSIY
jgi:hypothetical protein